MADKLSEWAKLGGERLPRKSEAAIMPARAASTAFEDRLDDLLKDIPPIEQAEFKPPEGKHLGKTALEKARKAWEEEQRQETLNRAMGRKACDECNEPETKEQRKARLEALLSSDITDPETVEATMVDATDETAVSAKLHDCEELLKDFESLGIGLPHAS